MDGRCHNRPSDPYSGLAAHSSRCWDCWWMMSLSWEPSEESWGTRSHSLSQHSVCPVIYWCKGWALWPQWRFLQGVPAPGLQWDTNSSLVTVSQPGVSLSAQSCIPSFPMGITYQNRPYISCLQISTSKICSGTCYKGSTKWWSVPQARKSLNLLELMKSL